MPCLVSAPWRRSRCRKRRARAGTRRAGRAPGYRGGGGKKDENGSVPRRTVLRPFPLRMAKRLCPGFPPCNSEGGSGKGCATPGLRSLSSRAQPGPSPGSRSLSLRAQPGPSPVLEACHCERSRDRAPVLEACHCERSRDRARSSKPVIASAAKQSRNAGRAYPKSWGPSACLQPPPFALRHRCEIASSRFALLAMTAGVWRVTPRGGSRGPSRLSQRQPAFNERRFARSPLQFPVPTSAHLRIPCD